MATRTSKKSTQQSAAEATASSPKAMSLHIGLNAVSAEHYGGWSGPLTACEFDANDMATIAASRSMSAIKLLTTQATRTNVLACMRDAAKKLVGGDLFFLTYSGHGGQIPDVTGEEPDKKDETWCLYDGQLIDDELYQELTKFAAGVRILVFSDSCHSGTVTREGPPSMGGAAPEARSRMMPEEVGLRTYTQNQAFYDKLQKDLANAGTLSLLDPDAALSALNVNRPRLTSILRKFKPAVILISGCQDNQTSADGAHNGLFTGRLLKVWNTGKFAGDYAAFHAKIKAGMPSYQTPNLFLLGNTAAFLAQKPFTV